MSTQPGPRKLGIVFPTSINSDEWARDHSLGRVPDRWPYGLHRLCDVSEQTVALSARPLGSRDKISLACTLLSSGRRSSKVGGLDVSLAWDEYSAIKMMAQHPSDAMFSGLIWATDTWLSKKPTVRSVATKHMLPLLAGLWCLSRPQVEETRRVTKGRVPVDFLPFGIDHEFFRFSEPPEKTRILSLGVDRDRDPETLFAALQLIRQASPKAEIMVQTEYRGRMPAGVTRFERVPHAALRDLYRTASVVLVPTKPNLHASGMTVALEAAATGRPVVACSTPGMEDYVVHGETGLLVRPQDPEAMAQATLEILNNKECAEDFGVQARRHVEHGHTTELMVSVLRDIIAKGL